MRVLVVLVIQLFMFSSLFGAAPNFNNKGYHSPLNPFEQWGNSWYECTRYAFGRAYEQTGTVLKFSVSSGRHGGKWYDIVKDLPRGTTPKANSLVIWTYGTYGHVGYVESVNGNNIKISEANWANPANGKYNGFKTLSSSQIKNRNGYKLKGYVYLTDNNSNGAGIFDGAGSIVSPNDDCFGCNRDYVRLHRHNGIGSTGVFQWLRDTQSCNHVNVYSTSDLGNVIIKRKGWADGPTKAAFKVKLDAYDKVSIKHDGNYWTTFAVTTEKPLKSSTATLIARCASKGSKFYNAGAKDVTKDLVDVTAGYYWTGTGSLITQSSGNRSFGQYKDLAHTFVTKKSLTSFQWYAKSGCKQVVISKGGTTAYVPVNSISIKGWAQPFSEWKRQSCQSLPCTVSASNGYHILKILTNPNALKGSSIQVKCK